MIDEIKPLRKYPDVHIHWFSIAKVKPVLTRSRSKCLRLSTRIVRIVNEIIEVLEILIDKIDFIEKEIRNKHLGYLGELCILKSEIEFLKLNH